MSAAHERAARRLAALAGAERDWILARLARADALRIGELMAREPAPAQAAPVPEAPADAESTPESWVARAAAADISQALREEPDWLVALVLGRRRWPWDREYLSGLEPERLETLGRLGREAAKPRAGEEAVLALAAMLRKLEPAPRPRSAFDDVLGGMTLGGGKPPQGGEAWPS